MIIESKEMSSRIKLGIMLITLVTLAGIVLSLIFSWSKNHILEYALIVFFILYVFFIYVKKYYYIYYNTDGPKIIIRYKSLIPLSTGSYSMEIPKRDFIKVEMKKKWSGLRNELIVYVHTPKGTAKFKPLSLSTLSRKERDLLINDITSL